MINRTMPRALIGSAIQKFRIFCCKVFTTSTPTSITRIFCSMPKFMSSPRLIHVSVTLRASWIRIAAMRGDGLIDADSSLAEFALDILPTTMLPTASPKA